MFRYSIKRLIYIAENYEEFEPDKNANNRIWASDRWTDIIDQKVDFDTALKQLTKLESNLVFDVGTIRVKERIKAFRKMRRWLNGEKEVERRF